MKSYTIVEDKPIGGKKVKDARVMVLGFYI